MQKFLQSSFLITLIFILSACVKPKAGEELRLGYLLNLTHLVPIVGLETKQFGKIIATHFSSGGYLVNALLTNNLDMVYIGPGPYLNALDKGVRLKLLRISCYGGNALILNEKYKRGEEFLIKRLAVPQLGNTQDLIAKLLVEKFKNDLLKDRSSPVPTVSFSEALEYIAVNPAEIEMVFHTHGVEAAVTAEPWGTLLESHGMHYMQDPRLNFINDYPTTLLVVREEYYQNHQAEVDAFVKTQDRILNEVKSNQDKATRLFQKHMKTIAKKDLKYEFLKTSFERIKFTSKIDNIKMQELADVLYEAKYTKKRLIVDAH